MAMLRSTIRFQDGTPSIKVIREKLEEQTGLSVSAEPIKTVSHDFDETSVFSTSQFRFTFEIPDKRIKKETVSCDFSEKIVTVRDFADMWNRCPNYYSLALENALVKLGGESENNEDDPFFNYGKLSWAQWCELNGGALPPLWRRIAANIVGYSAMIFLVVYILALYAIALTFIAVCISLLLKIPTFIE